jgi:hypothetical protein
MYIGPTPFSVAWTAAARNIYVGAGAVAHCCSAKPAMSGSKVCGQPIGRMTPGVTAAAYAVRNAVVCGIVARHGRTLRAPVSRRPRLR